MTEGEMVGWHHRLKGHEFKQALGDGEGQGSLVCCSPWGHKESDTTERRNNNLISVSMSRAITRMSKKWHVQMVSISDWHKPGVLKLKVHHDPLEIFLVTAVLAGVICISPIQTSLVLSNFSSTCWPSVCLLWEKAYSGLLPTF